MGRARNGTGPKWDRPEMAPGPKWNSKARSPEMGHLGTKWDGPEMGSLGPKLDGPEVGQGRNESWTEMGI